MGTAAGAAVANPAGTALTLTAPNASGAGAGSATGAGTTITVAAPQATASGSAVATCALTTIALNPLAGVATAGGGSKIIFTLDNRVDIGDYGDNPGVGPELVLGSGTYRIDLSTGRFVRIFSPTVVMTL